MNNCPRACEGRVRRRMSNDCSEYDKFDLAEEMTEAAVDNSRGYVAHTIPSYDVDFTVSVALSRRARHLD